ncbi:MAG TPA: ABC transporter ATP-binding protein [Chondromyces sp.]|nr:ABC transporter ATP-binding protein [Chondromyces sp.]
MKLQIERLTKAFDDREVIKGLNLKVNEGEFVSIIGPSGSGKSTLFHLIGGLLQPDSGDIFLNGIPITGEKGHIAYMPQQPSLMPWRTILDNVLLGQELAGKKETGRALEMLHMAGLGGYEKSYPHELSGGMKQRASFLRALLSPQTILCLDEPFSALDEFTRLEMQKWLLDIWEQNRQTVLFITHNIEEAVLLSDRIIVLSERPATIKEEFAVPFPRPRNEEIMMEEEFFYLKREIYEMLKSKRENEHV